MCQGLFKWSSSNTELYCGPRAFPPAAQKRADTHATLQPPALREPHATLHVRPCTRGMRRRNGKDPRLWGLRLDQDASAAPEPNEPRRKDALLSAKASGESS